MASAKSFKHKPFIFSCILFLTSLTFFTFRNIKHLHNGFPIEAHITQSPKNPKWFDIIAVELGHNQINVGLVNIDGMAEAFHTEGKIVEAYFDRVNKSVKWSDLYPSWINEKGSPKCPSLPMPRFEEYDYLDVVVARVPCGECNEENGLRDVFRLQVNLVVANLLVRSGRNGENNVFAVFVGEIEPMWDIFRCDDLLWNERNVWVYKPELWRIEQDVVLPVGSCQLAPPFAQSAGQELGRTYGNAIKHHRGLGRPVREAYVTVLHSSESYVCGAIVLAQSIIQSNSTKDLILLADDHISPTAINGLQSAGWKVRRIQRVRNPHSKEYSYNEWNYSKLRIWQLTDYDKLIFIDSDLIGIGNLDELFNYPQISAAGNDRDRFNSGLMVIEPSDCTFQTLMKKRFTVRSYNGGDQGFLNEMFLWWHRLSRSVNQMKFFPSDHSEHRTPDGARAIHYLGWKPWLCYRDYDCNWDKVERWHFASDSANERWWRVYDTLPEELRGLCRLMPKTAERIEEYRRRARDGNYTDRHWMIKVMDPRRIEEVSQFNLSK